MVLQTVGFPIERTVVSFPREGMLVCPQDAGTAPGTKPSACPELNLNISSWMKNALLLSLFFPLFNSKMELGITKLSLTDSLKVRV